MTDEDVLLLSISLDAERDTPEDLREYAELYEAGPGWLFLTGSRPDVEHLRHRLGAYDPDPEKDADKTNHSGMLVFLNEPLGRMTAISGLMPVEAIQRSLKQLLE